MNIKSLKNIFFLGVIQVSNAVLPLLVFPRCLSLFGPERYALLSTGEVISILVLTFVIFSFDINGTSEIVENRADPKFSNDKLRKTYTEVFFTRLLLFCFSSLLILLLISFFKPELLSVTAFWLLIPLSYIFQSHWLFLGIQENGIPALTSGLSRGVVIVVIYLFIDAASAISTVPLIVGSIYMIGGLGNFLYLQQVKNIKLIRVNFTFLKTRLVTGYKIFVGNVSTFLYKDFNVIIIGYVATNSSDIASFHLADKIIKGVQASVRPINTFYFPQAIEKIKNIHSPNKRSAHLLFDVVKKSVLVLFFIALVMFVLGLSFEDVLAKKFENLQLIEVMITIMFFSIFPGTANFVFGSIGLNYLNSQTYLLRSIVLVGFISVLLSFTLTYFFDSVGTAVIYSFSEVLLLVLCLAKYLRPQK